MAIVVTVAMVIGAMAIVVMVATVIVSMAMPKTETVY